MGWCRPTEIESTMAGRKTIHSSDVHPQRALYMLHCVLWRAMRAIYAYLCQTHCYSKWFSSARFLHGKHSHAAGIYWVVLWYALTMCGASKTPPYYTILCVCLFVYNRKQNWVDNYARAKSHHYYYCVAPLELHSVYFLALISLLCRTRCKRLLETSSSVCPPPYISYDEC